MEKKILLTITLIVCTFFGFSQTWTGTDITNPNDWNTAGNWSSANVPVSTDNITIPGGLTNYPIINSIVSINNLTIDAGAVLTLNTSAELTVSGTLTNNAGSAGLLINSDISGVATLIQNSSSVSATVKNFLNPVSNQYQYISSPITAASASMFAGNNFYYYDEPMDDYWGTTKLLNGWVKYTTGSLDVLKGYAYYTGTKTLTYQGELNYNASNFNIPLLYTSHPGNTIDGDAYSIYDGWNLIGNPYTCYLDWAQLGLTFLDQTVYYYNGSTGNYSYYNLTGPVSVNSATKYIAPMQGFFVKSDVGGNIEITPSSMLHTSQRVVTKTGNDLSDIIKLEVSANNFSDESVIRFISGASSDFENKYDAYKRFSDNQKVPQLFSEESKVNYAINSLDASDNSKEVQLGLICVSGKSYSITAKEMNFSLYNHVYLEDKLSGKITELTPGTKYSFDFENDVQNTKRFILHFEKSATSVNENQSQDIEVYPNPANDYVYIAVNSEKVKYSVSNITGQKLLSGQLSEDKKLDISTFPKGVYFININTDDNNSTLKRIIKQ